MKILGRGKDHVHASHAMLLVEMTGDEFCMIAGYAYDTQLKEARPDCFDNRGYLLVGAQVPVSEMFRFITDLKEKERQCRDVAGLFRRMAEMIDGSLPSTLVAPPGEPQHLESTS